MKAKILWIEGKKANSPSFIPALRKKGYTVEPVLTGNQAFSRLPDFEPDVVIINAASMRSTGKRICATLREAQADIPILLILSTDQEIKGDFCANVTLSLPFTSRKLVNRIEGFLWGDSEAVLKAGPITLNIQRRRVKCNEQQARLTPRLAELLLIFLQHPGEVLLREQLFKDLWDTDYIGDTRTLDVHISWLRQAIEVNPRRPTYLKTVRGVGYRLDV